MKLYFKYIVSLYLIALGTHVNAQDSLQMQVIDSVEIIINDSLKSEEIDSLRTEDARSLTIETIDSTQIEVKEHYFAILVGTDYGKLITTAAQFEIKYEFNVGLQFSKKMRVTADYGYGNLAPPNAIENGTYSSFGTYYRIGLDYTFNIYPKIYLSLGGMYASSSFKDEGTVEIQSEVWPSFNETFVRDNFNANWAEFVITSEAPIINTDQGFFNNLYWGIKFRFRFLMDRPQPENFDVYAIPGYGRTWNDFVPAANLFVVYKL